MYSQFRDFYYNHLNDNQFMMLNTIVSIGPMPQDILNFCENQYMMNTRTSVANGELFNELQYYWPSGLIPPYSMPIEFLLTWYDDVDERVWIIVSVI